MILPAPRLPRFDDGPGGGISHQGRQNRVIELVPAAHRTIRPQQGGPRKGEIAYGIERFVAHEFVGKSHTIGVEYAVLGHNQGILKRRPERVARAPQFGDVTHETEGPRSRNLATETVGFHIKVE